MVVNPTSAIKLSAVSFASFIHKLNPQVVPGVGMKSFYFKVDAEAFAGSVNGKVEKIFFPFLTSHFVLPLTREQIDRSHNLGNWMVTY